MSSNAPSAWATQSCKGVGYTQQNAEALRTQVQYVVDFTARHCTT